jgi:hypothetical protein
MEADSAKALRQVLAGHPHYHAPSGEIRAYEFLFMPGL